MKGNFTSGHYFPQFTKDWLQSRCGKHVKQEYILKPNEIKRKQEFKTIFDNFDEDKSSIFSITRQTRQGRNARHVPQVQDQHGQVLARQVLRKN